MRHKSPETATGKRKENKNCRFCIISTLIERLRHFFSRGKNVRKSSCQNFNNANIKPLKRDYDKSVRRIIEIVYSDANPYELMKLEQLKYQNFFSRGFVRLIQHNGLKHFQFQEADESMRFHWFRSLSYLYFLMPNETDEALDAYVKFCFRLPAFVVYNIENILEQHPQASSLIEQLGNGTAPEALTGLSFRLNKRMAHHFKNAPLRCDTIVQAVLYAQVKTLGGNSSLFETIAEDIPAGYLEENDFWTNAIVFYLWETDNYEDELTTDEQFFGYIRHRKSTDKSFSLEPGNFKSILPEMKDFYRKSQRQPTAKVNNFKLLAEINWPGANYLSFEKHIGKQQKFIIRQLCNNSELDRESQELNHTFFQYWQKCKDNVLSVWSCRIAGKTNQERTLATIVVSRNGLILNMAGMDGRKVSGIVKRYIEEWAEREGLAFSLRGNIDRDLLRLPCLN